MTLELEPTHWLPIPPDPKDDEPRPSIEPWLSIERAYF